MQPKVYIISIYTCHAQPAENEIDEVESKLNRQGNFPSGRVVRAPDS